jgi:esterase/lipase
MDNGYICRYPFLFIHYLQTMKRIITRIFQGLLLLLSLLTGTYFLGPKPASPQLVQPMLTAFVSLPILEQEIDKNEKQVKGIKPENEAKIVWADSTKKVKTKVAMLYLHGFGASEKEGYPTNIHLADTFDCNMYLARLSEHGINVGDDNFLNFTADSYYQSGEKALHIAQQLGDSVVIISTSAGAALGLFLASRHPEVKAILMYSPAIKLYKKEAAMMPGPWGLQIAKWVTGKDHNDWVYKNASHAKYWTNHQRFEGVVQFSIFLKETMIPSTFNQVKCPVFMGYYYRDEENQDKVVSVAAMQEMFEQLGTSQHLKRKIDFPNANNHVIATSFLSDEWQNVEAESIKFMREITKM